MSQPDAPPPTGTLPTRLVVTFDVDMVDGRWGRAEDECGYFLETVAPEVLAAGVTAATVFIRVDDDIARRYGSGDYLLVKYAEDLQRLRQLGWEIGWHPHPYTARPGEPARQNTDAQEIAAELIRHGPRARAEGMTSVRMGWGFITSRLIEILDGLGFLADSSAIPRPRYAWERSVKDWSPTPPHPYQPSVEDYRVPGVPHRQIVELPMTVAPIAASYDTEPVLRYINPAYRASVFADAVRAIGGDILLMIAHPHELLPCEPAHELLSGDVRVLRENLQFLIDAYSQRGLQWMTVSRLASLYAHARDGSGNEPSRAEAVATLPPPRVPRSPACG